VNGLVLIIDAHVHVYSDDDIQYPTISSPLRPPGESGYLSTFETIAGENQVVGACMVQTLSVYGWDNHFLCDVSKAHPKHIAGVCSLDPENLKSPTLLREYVEDWGVRGLRSYPASNGRLNHPGVEELWRQAEALNIVVNVSVTRDNTDDLAWMLERFPNQPVVIDHCLIPRPVSDSTGAVKDMMRLAKYPNAYAKLNFLPVASVEEFPFRDMHEPCYRMIAAYGPNRCVWGNSFPCQLWSQKSSYAQNLHLFTDELELGEGTKPCILGETANRLWFGNRLLLN
jgi:predicted TIM-barrel fold metal-dependent hydrolase